MRQRQDVVDVLTSRALEAVPPTSAADTTRSELRQADVNPVAARPFPRRRNLQIRLHRSRRPLHNRRGSLRPLRSYDGRRIDPRGRRVSDEGRRCPGERYLRLAIQHAKFAHRATGVLPLCPAGPATVQSWQRPADPMDRRGRPTAPIHHAAERRSRLEGFLGPATANASPREPSRRRQRHPESRQGRRPAQPAGRAHGRHRRHPRPFRNR